MLLSFYGTKALRPASNRLFQYGYIAKILGRGTLGGRLLRKVLDKLPFFQHCQKTMHGRSRIARSFGNFDRAKPIGFACDNFEQMQCPEQGLHGAA
jgi:hypothetical protein